MRASVVLFFTLLITYLPSYATNDSSKINIIPQPSYINELPGNFEMTNQTVIVYKNAAQKKIAAYLADYLHRFYRLKIETKIGSKSLPNTILLLPMAREGTTSESYLLDIKQKSIVLSGSDRGIFYGVQSILQLLPGARDSTISLPCALIKDTPRFAYRGMMLDCGRHFFDVSFVKRFIDLLGLHKMNTFHWHLTEDQGWRIQIKKYPRLTSIGAWRDSTLSGSLYDTPQKYDGQRYGGFYTQNEIKEIVKYAKDRFITIIPEIEMPGHATAALAAYPELGCRNGSYSIATKWGVSEDVFCPSEATFTFLDNVLTEVAQLFPGEYIHVGGDECPKKQWKKSALCQQIIKTKGLKDEEELQAYFMDRVRKILQSKGRKMIAWAWDDMLEGKYAASKDVIIMHWQVEKRTGVDAINKGYKVVSVPGAYTYFDYSQRKGADSLNMGSYLPMSKVYEFEPAPDKTKDENKKNIIGSQGNVWTEYMKWPSKVEYMILPRMSALSEVLWSPISTRNYSSFKQKMLKQRKRYELWGMNYHKFTFEALDTAN
jgi:hexosaminidase